MRRRLEVTLKYLLLSLLCLPLWAQTEKQDDKDDVVSETKVVTATKTERKLVELPISATVMEREDLTRKGAVVAGEELQSVPGVFLRSEGAGAAQLSVNIRGLTGVHGNDTFDGP